MATRQEQIRKILSEVGQGFKADYELGKDDSTRMYYRTRNLQGLTDEAPKATNMMNTHQGIYRLREALGKLDPSTIQALNERDMALRGSTAHKTGQFLGSAANDLTQDTSRGIYWLLNALQATGEVINESALARAVPQLYEKSPVQSIKSFTKEAGKPKVARNLERGNSTDVEEMLERGIAKQIDDRLAPSRGYSFNDATGELVKRNYSPGMVQSLAIPTGVAINSGLGLLTPFGGAEGYKAALPSEDDPSVTSNVLGEIGLKYIMGQTGQMLPYNEFNQVRPDVSPGEYNKYQAFKYDKNVDLDPTDGDITLPGGAIKATTEGIHGPELQFLGRSLPVTTGVVPYLSALAGGVAGARYGQRTNRAAIGGLTGGMGGLVTGQVVGNIIEQERRRRNSVENELQGTNAEQYLT
tara:strand:+ start:591 stop:1826 length:1236 start_codon:yes stop_codon:yes gene_type:complete